MQLYSYELDGFSGRISAYYQGTTYTSIEGSLIFLDEIQEAYVRFDLHLSQRLKVVPGLVFCLNSYNFTNSSLSQCLFYHPHRQTGKVMYGATGEAGIRYTF